MSSVRTGLELRVILNTDIELVCRDFSASTSIPFGEVPVMIIPAFSISSL